MANGPAPFFEIGKRARGKPALEIMYSFLYVIAPRCFLYVAEYIHGYQPLCTPEQHPIACLAANMFRHWNME